MVGGKCETIRRIICMVQNVMFYAFYNYRDFPPPPVNRLRETKWFNNYTVIVSRKTLKFVKRIIIIII